MLGNPAGNVKSSIRMGNLFFKLILVKWNNMTNEREAI